MRQASAGSSGSPAASATSKVSTCASGVVLRGTRRHPLRVADRVLVGPHSYLTGCTIDDEAFLATGTRVFNGAHIGRNAEIQINATVHLLTPIAVGALVPIEWIAVGDPAQLLPSERHDEISAIQEPLDFPGVVFGMPALRQTGTCLRRRLPGTPAHWHATPTTRSWPTTSDARGRPARRAIRGARSHSTVRSAQQPSSSSAMPAKTRPSTVICRPAER